MHKLVKQNRSTSVMDEAVLRVLRRFGVIRWQEENSLLRDSGVRRRLSHLPSQSAYGAALPPQLRCPTP